MPGFNTKLNQSFGCAFQLRFFGKDSLVSALCEGIGTADSAGKRKQSMWRIFTNN